MSDRPTPETDAENDTQCELAAWELLREARRERDEAREELAEWNDSALHVRQEYDDEQHCSCVPILRKLLKDAERERDEARKELEEYRSIAEKIGAKKAVSEKEKAIRERDEARSALIPFITLNPKSQRVLKKWDGFVEAAKKALKETK